jgi:hypothetical protein
MQEVGRGMRGKRSADLLLVAATRSLPGHGAT